MLVVLQMARSEKAHTCDLKVQAGRRLKCHQLHHPRQGVSLLLSQPLENHTWKEWCWNPGSPIQILLGVREGGRRKSQVWPSRVFQGCGVCNLQLQG